MTPPKVTPSSQINPTSTEPPQPKEDTPPSQKEEVTPLIDANIYYGAVTGDAYLKSPIYGGEVGITMPQLNWGMSAFYLHFSGKKDPEDCDTLCKYNLSSNFVGVKPHLDFITNDKVDNIGYGGFGLFRIGLPLGYYRGQNSGNASSPYSYKDYDHFMMGLSAEFLVGALFGKKEPSVADVGFPLVGINLSVLAIPFGEDRLIGGMATFTFSPAIPAAIVGGVLYGLAKDPSGFQPSITITP